jgi:hypothetical protein
MSVDDRPKGIAVIRGAVKPCPIVNIPPDARKVRLRLRHDSFAVAFVKFDDRIERWAIVPDGGKLEGATRWRLGLLRGVNAAQ